MEIPENNENNFEESESQNPLHNFSGGFAAKKSLGQNFLHAPHVVSAMVHAGEISAQDIILEVGPGKGALTEALLKTNAHIIAIEKDDRAIPFLSEKFPSEIKSGKLKIIHADILEINIESLGLRKGEYKIIANIPYYISGEFLRKFLESETQPERIVVMLQRELAKRIVDTKQSILSISVKAYGYPKYVVTVPRKFFRPMPNVDSAVLLIEKISKNFFKNGSNEKSILKNGANGSEKEVNLTNNDKIDEKWFFEVLKAGFAHKRKVLIKNLEDKINTEQLKKLWLEQNWSLTIRAEELSLDDWKKIVCFPQKEADIL